MLYALLDYLSVKEIVTKYSDYHLYNWVCAQLNTLTSGSASFLVPSPYPVERFNEYNMRTLPAS